ncbi:MAG: glycoside hydrolase family 3 N-terminal domain-containing protein [Candidatus Coatesbacteria bacterium]
MNVGSLLRRMNLQEKVMQLCSLMEGQVLDRGAVNPRKLRKVFRHGMGSFTTVTRQMGPREGTETYNRLQRFLLTETRMKIPAILHDECLHGCMAKGSTIFPQALALASAWDPDLLERVASAIGLETRARGISQALSPTINIARDPRCGRSEETYGEDVLLTTRLAVAFIRGIQARGVAATPKHFAANFMGDGGRDSHEIHFSERELRETYFPAFEAAVREAGALSIMPAYNAINGVPCASDPWLLTDVLRKEWGFEGIAGSDYWAIDGIYQKHRTAKDAAEAARVSLAAGMDVDWPSATTFPHLVGEVRKGRISERVVDRSVLRVLRVKEKLGLFENPYADPHRAVALNDCAPHRALALEAARKGMVLLRNEKGALPLGKVRRVAVLGPNADEARTGGYSGHGVRVVKPLEGIRARLGKSTDVLYARGCELLGDDESGIDRAVAAARKADVAIVVVGGWSGGSWEKHPYTEGEGRDRCRLELSGVQEKLILAVAAANRRTVVVIVNGSVVAAGNWAHRVPAILNAWYPGEEGGTAIAEVLCGDVNPSGKLPLGMPFHTGELPWYYNSKPSGRAPDYNDRRGALAQFPFGHGLSYTSFKCDALETRRTPDGAAVSCTIRNLGKRAGDEVVQLYVHDRMCSLVRPLMELKGWQRLRLAPGEQTRVDFALTRRDLGFLGPRLKPVFEPGEFEIMVGASSGDIRLRRTEWIR